MLFGGFHMVEQSREQVEEQAREQVLCLVENNELYSKALAIGLQELKEKGEIYWNVKGQTDILLEKCPKRCPIRCPERIG